MEKWNKEGYCWIKSVVKEFLTVSFENKSIKKISLRILGHRQRLITVLRKVKKIKESKTNNIRNIELILKRETHQWC